MLSAAASDVVVVVELSTLKYRPQILPPSCKPVEEHITSAWAPDNSALYLASSHTISRYGLSSKQLVALHTPNDGYLIRCLVVKDKSTVIYGAGCSIHILGCGDQKPKVAQSFGPYEQDILSLSLSNDTTLLACGLSNAAYIHNLTTGSQTTLRGLPSNSSITICTFHPHVRTRLLIGSLDQLLVYDTTRPSIPMKIIPMNDAGTCIQAIACSPFSKTLVAVAMSDGGVGLIDLDKEKGLFRALHLNVPLTTISFSSEGGSIYLGTENGKLLVQDLRALVKPPKSIIVSESGNPINTLAVQQKLKELPQNIKGNGTSKVLVKSMSSTPISKATVATPLRPRVTCTSSSSVTTSIHRGSIAEGTPKHTPMSRSVRSKKVLTPTRDPYGNSPRLESITVKAKNTRPPENASMKQGDSSTRGSLSLGTRVRTNSSANRRRMPPATADAFIVTQPGNLVADESSISNARSRSRSRNAPSTSEPASVIAGSRSSRSVSSSSFASSSTHCKPSFTPSIPPVSSISATFVANSRPASPMSGDKSQTPSLDLPEMKVDLNTPIPAQKKKKAMTILGLGTPEISAWIKAGMPRSQVSHQNGTQNKARVKSVGFEYDTNDARGDRDDHAGERNGHEDQLQERERSLSLQISPRRPLSVILSPQSHDHEAGHAWNTSPMTRPQQAVNTPGTLSSGSAHELLRTIVKDVMFDFQRETRAEMMGLHLDLVRMGRGWKRELRTLMDEYVGDLNDLREENRRLKEENDRLRGF